MTGPRAVGIHIYSGLWTLGWQDAGFDVVAQLEELTAGAETAKLNLGDRLLHHVGPLENWPLAQLRDTELVYANCPCAPWSAVGRGLNLADPRVQYSHDAAIAALELQPSFFVLESVPRAWSPKGGRLFYEELAGLFQREGYGVTILFTNAVLHGAPQHRNRFHFIAHKLALNLQEPVLERPMTVRDAIGDLEYSAVFGDTGVEPAVANHVSKRPREKDLNTIQRTRQGEGLDAGYRRAVAEGLDAAKFRFIAGRFRYDAPAPVLLDIDCTVHPTQDRFLTVREGARLCGYPDDFVFVTSRHTRDGGHGVNSSELTQAVLPHIGRYLGKQFLRALDAPEEHGLTETRIIDHRPLAVPFAPSRYLGRV